MKKYRNIFIGLTILTALLVPKFFCNQKKQDGNSKPGGGSKIPIKVGVLVMKDEFVSQSFQVSGTLLANEQVQLNSETQGLVTKIYFKEGADVRKGELLLKMNDADLQAQLKKANANKKLKDENAKRNEILLKKEAISQNDYDVSVTELNAIDADIEYLREMIRKTEIRAPFSGTIGLRYISAGAYLTPTTTIATLEDESQLKLAFSIPEKYAMKVKVGDAITFSVSGSDEVYKATIYAREASVSDQTRAINMRALCNNIQRKLMPGLFANIYLKLGSERNSFMIPTQAMVPVLKGQKVYLVQGDTAIEKMIKTGFRNETQIEVLEGLSNGDSLIVDGIMYMKSGVRVKATKKEK
jgi:membrane fusion protein (multidrug efflux system)